MHEGAWETASRWTPQERKRTERPVRETTDDVGRGGFSWVSGAKPKDWDLEAAHAE